MLYGLVAISFVLILGLALSVHFFLPKREKLINHRILPIALIVLFACRTYFYKGPQMIIANYAKWAWFNGPMNPFLNTVGQVGIWFEITAVLLVLMRAFFDFPSASWYAKWVSPIILFLCCIAAYPILVTMQGSDAQSTVYYFLPLELGAMFAYSLYFFIVDFRFKLDKKYWLRASWTIAFLNIFAVQPFTPAFFFGLGTQCPIDFSVSHRIFLYFTVFIIVAIYAAFRGLEFQKRKYAMIFISLATLTNFMCNYKVDIFFDPWYWPIHLCNTAMFLMPLVAIFPLKRLFYFTYFINVFGAMMAMFMPDYKVAYTFFYPTIVHFWVNHIMALGMPLLCVALGLYQRPRLKQFFWSILWLFVYYLIVLFLNPLFGALGHKTDIFFINSNFIGDKLGDWSKTLFNITWTLKLGNMNLVFHPPYQIIYFFSYILLSFAMWFVYQLGFDIADNHYALHVKLAGIRQDEIALKSVLNGRSIEEPMKENAGIKLELRDFSKKYGMNKNYAVEKASFTVHGGEVFGFLGPNGAGKSTIIKSIVGIQPFTEGEIFVCGYNAKSQPVQAKSQIGFVPDHYALYERLTGREYLNYIADIYKVSKEDRDARIEEHVKLFELEDAIDSLIKTYSHGMKQKIAIIAALVHDPKVWILDEPLTGLDPQSIRQVKECMKRHAERGNIVFFSSHLIDLVEKLCDRIAIIQHGHILCQEAVRDIEDSGVGLEDFYLGKIGFNKEEKEKA